MSEFTSKERVALEQGTPAAAEPASSPPVPDPIADAVAPDNEPTAAPEGDQDAGPWEFTQETYDAQQADIASLGDQLGELVTHLQAQQGDGNQAQQQPDDLGGINPDDFDPYDPQQLQQVFGGMIGPALEQVLGPYMPVIEQGLADENEATITDAIVGHLEDAAPLHSGDDGVDAAREIAQGAFQDGGDAYETLEGAVDRVRSIEAAAYAKGQADLKAQLEGAVNAPDTVPAGSPSISPPGEMTEGDEMDVARRYGPALT